MGLTVVVVCVIATGDDEKISLSPALQDFLVEKKTATITKIPAIQREQATTILIINSFLETCLLRWLWTANSKNKEYFTKLKKNDINK